MKHFSSLTALAVLLSGLSFSALAADPAENFSVSNVYGSNMVLQRDVPVRIAGKADAGKTVKVVMTSQDGKDKAEAEATAGKDGIWRVSLPAKKAGGPYTVTILGAKDKKVELTNILMGDVWICAGQSNMEMPVWGKEIFYREDAGDKIASIANDNQLRLYQTPRNLSPFTENFEVTKPGSWEVATSFDAVMPFSSTGYFFGLQLRKRVNVPIGLVNSSWGGTQIEPWMPFGAFQKLPNRKDMEEVTYLYHNKNIPTEKNPEIAWADYNKKVKAWTVELEKAVAVTGEKARKEFSAIEVNKKDWEEAKFETNWQIAILGTFWTRAEFELTEADLKRNQDMTLFIDCVDDCDETFVNGAFVGKTWFDTPEYWSAKRAYKVPAKLLKAGKNVVAIRVMNNNGTGGPRGAVILSGDDKQFSLNISEKGKWYLRTEYKIEGKLLAECPLPPSVMTADPQYPTTLYNSMIHPFTEFPVKGVIWYQGCSNADRPAEYAVALKEWVNGWRAAWNQPDMPFVIVQLTGYISQRPSTPRTSKELFERGYLAGHAPLREAQATMLDYPNCGVAVTIDIGNHSDIHPHNKIEFAPRIAAEAMRVAYGAKELSHGPVFLSAKADGERMIVSFKDIGQGLATSDGKAPQEFMLAGEDKVFHPANAEIKGDTVVVTCADVKAPKYVRYAWRDYCSNPNLINKDGFHAFPFRNDGANGIYDKAAEKTK